MLSTLELVFVTSLLSSVTSFLCAFIIYNNEFKKLKIANESLNQRNTGLRSDNDLLKGNLTGVQNMLNDYKKQLYTMEGYRDNLLDKITKIKEIINVD